MRAGCGVALAVACLAWSPPARAQIPERPADPEAPAALAAAAGYVAVAGSVQEVRHGAALRLTWRGDRVWASPWLTAYSGVDALAFGTRVGVRLWSPARAPGTSFAAVLEVSHQAFPADSFYVTGLAAALEARVGCGGLTRVLRWLHVLARLGVGVEGYGYAATGPTWDDGRPLLVADLGFGARVPGRLELEVLYRQLKSELPGGLLASGTCVSCWGMLDVRARVTLHERWAALFGVRQGAGTMPWVALEASVR
ncbi:MAG: hypothetical protein HY906_03115 [Deltaproteobacteria bacterium]|nr:hypothetical protein [Deltaproteobacteria bacterium]